MRFSIRCCFYLLLVMTLGACAGTSVRGGGGVIVHDGGTHVGVIFTSGDRRHIHDYYHEHHRYYERRYKGRKGLPPGLAKRDQLPPGLAKRDRRPPGLYGYHLPYELDRRLSRLPDGVIRLRIGTSIVLMDEHSRVVLDIIKDIPFH